MGLFSLILDFERWLKTIGAWIDGRLKVNEGAFLTSLMRRYLCLILSIFPPGISIILIWNMDDGSKLMKADHGIIFAVCAAGVPLLLSVICMLLLPSIRNSDANLEESVLMLQILLVFTTGSGFISALAAPPKDIGLYLNTSFILWAFLFENPLGIAMRMGLINAGVSMTVGYIRSIALNEKKEKKEWFWFLIVPFLLAFSLNLFSWRFKKSFFPEELRYSKGSQILEEAKQLVTLMEREQRDMENFTKLVGEAKRLANSHTESQKATLAAHAKIIASIQTYESSQSQLLLHIKKAVLTAPGDVGEDVAVNVHD